MKFETFEDIITWKKAKDLYLYIKELFKSNKDYDFVRQYSRAVLSISNNIAEGFERKTNKEFTYFLFVAKGSAGEARSMTHMANELKYIDKNQYKKLLNDLIEISKLLSGLIKSIR